VKSDQHFSDSIEDYLEAIYLLGQTSVRSIDIANRLGVSRASVSRAVTTLKEKGMVSKLPYGNISLTEYGLNVSQNVEKKHRILKHFLTDILGVEESRANIEACGIEHDISDETADRIAALLEKQKKS